LWTTKSIAQFDWSILVVTSSHLAVKAQFGGQRFGEMEGWAFGSLAAAAYTSAGMLTVKIG